MKSADIRKKFLEFFKSKGHEIFPSSSLIPADPTMLLTTAGMVQFKPIFEGTVKPKHKRIATAQKCARTTDIDRVGHTARHLTFFEMLGNFSFGDYYKKEAINWAWELLTDVYKLDKSRLWATVFTDDDEAFSIWEKDIDIVQSRIARLSAEHNFWKAGDVGPCGPSSEIIYDFGEQYGCGPNCQVGCDCDRWLEIWNLVFMQYECKEDGSLAELPKKNIDTGMGLERVTAVLQKAKDNWRTDLLKPILDKVSELSGVVLGQSSKKDISLKIITDHCRAIAFLIADGVIPSNEGRGYILRRLLRRSIRHGWLLGLEKPFLDKVLGKVMDIMGKVYPELESHSDYIIRIVTTEEEKFGSTLRQGTEIINEHIAKLKQQKKKVLSGEIVFKLHDTYGFPAELTAEIASENGLSVDKEKFDKLMQEQKKRARAAWKEEEREYTPIYNEVLEEAGTTEFVGYTELKTEAEVKSIVSEQRLVKELKAGQEGEIILDKSPFYAEKGGQVADTGKITGSRGEAKVVDVKEGLGELILHKVKIAKGTIATSDTVMAEVNIPRRLALMRAHTATHLLHWALRTLLGSHVKQAGSLVEDDRLRFDFTHFEALTSKQIKEIEDMVNEKILGVFPVKAYTTTLDYAKQLQAVAFFGEKYGDFVRVVEAGDFSKELCGGTHVANTSFINLFKIISEGSVGANLRRIEAYTGRRLFKRLDEDEELIRQASSLLKVGREALVPKVGALNKDISALHKKLEKARKGGMAEQIEKVAASAKIYDKFKVVAYKLGKADLSQLRGYSDALRSKLGNSAVMLASTKDGKALMIAAASKEAVDKGFDARAWLSDILPIIKGSGGGKPSLAQAGGKEPRAIPEALEKAIEYASKWAKKVRSE